MSEEASILVLVTLQRHCARLIRRGADMALKQRRPLKVLHVAKRKAANAPEAAVTADILNDLYALANEAGAEMCLLTSDVMVTAAAAYAKEHGIKQIVMGAGEQAHGIAETLSGLLPGVAVLIAEAEAE